MGSDETPRRLHVHFAGRVQGVGFRYTVCRIAENFDVVGFVRNLWDGDVELVAEGLEVVLTDFLHNIRNSELKRYIARDRMTWEAASGEFERFGVSF